ncbi:hypothetical protein [Paenibacillus sp. NAIST15-1]|uniref:hypothetical protein n=1 Tax=Paenibacillus sp. NAIST15-1 TaxID=1605994 RepID=UPI000869EE74|nr:hypothetical protein [Paenibacillus sp. NAIST15-1]GAV11463.1 glycosyltransferase [Paenibacillus sp. NAIST15-1]
MEVKVIQARLRPKRDDDLKKAFMELPDHVDKADIIREAMRQYFFGGGLKNNAVNNIKLVNDDSSSIMINKVEDSDDDLDAKLDFTLDI